MKPILTFVFIIVVFKLFGQKVHHQMISSQGKTSTTNSGVIVKHTIGQLSVTGNFKGSFFVQQGFQQSLWANYLSSSDKVHITTSPNPFTEIVNFNLNNINADRVTVQIFDISGKLVFGKEQLTTNNQYTLNLSTLSIGTYLVRLYGKELNHYTKIIKI
ncbi:MAG: T9SS type A sorting domain-containing protein [Flavobacteriaceae bacterium]|jgi:hypothetical protein|nr:T9SS type A sorting domain-containing protein [Flavobacteriaceae bacterium]MDG2275080.1 T9SS type A sorting domain-containing protein [Flavobacteriaceae bacterium]